MITEKRFLKWSPCSHTNSLVELTNNLEPFRKHPKKHPHIGHNHKIWKPMTPSFSNLPRTIVTSHHACVKSVIFLKWRGSKNYQNDCHSCSPGTIRVVVVVVVVVWRLAGWLAGWLVGWFVGCGCWKKGRNMRRWHMSSRCNKKLSEKVARYTMVMLQIIDWRIEYLESSACSCEFSYRKLTYPQKGDHFKRKFHLPTMDF